MIFLHKLKITTIIIVKINYFQVIENILRMFDLTAILA